MRKTVFTLAVLALMGTTFTLTSCKDEKESSSDKIENLKEDAEKQMDKAADKAEEMKDDAKKSLKKSEKSAQKSYDKAKIKAKEAERNLDRKSTRLNSSHVSISYAVVCL